MSLAGDFYSVGANFGAQNSTFFMSRVQTHRKYLWKAIDSLERMNNRAPLMVGEVKNLKIY